MTAQSDPTPQLRSVHRQIRFATARVVAALMLREMATTYGRRPGGYLWIVLEPVAGIALMTWLFGLAMRHPPLGTNFALFYATGLLPYYLFMHVSQKLAQALGYSRQLLAYPRVTILDALLARFVLNLLTELLVAYLVILSVLLVFDPGARIDLPHVVLGFGMAAALAFGIGTLNCFLQASFPVWASVWAIIMRPMMFVSGAMLLIESLPVEWRPWLLWNPLVHIIAEVRRGFYHGYDPSYLSPVYVVGVALGTGAVGLLFLWRTHRDLLER